MEISSAGKIAETRLEVRNCKAKEKNGKEVGYHSSDREMLLLILLVFTIPVLWLFCFVGNS